MRTPRTRPNHPGKSCVFYVLARAETNSRTVCGERSLRRVLNSIMKWWGGRLSSQAAKTVPTGCSKSPFASVTAEEMNPHVSYAEPREIRILTINAWFGLTNKDFFKLEEHPNIQKSDTNCRRVPSDDVSLWLSEVPVSRYATQVTNRSNLFHRKI